MRVYMKEKGSVNGQIKRGRALIRRAAVLMLVLSIIFTGCASKSDGTSESEKVELVYRFAPNESCSVIEEYVKQLNDEADGAFTYYVVDDKHYARKMDKSEHDVWLQQAKTENWHKDTFMDALENATGIDFREYVTRYEANTTLTEFALYMKEDYANDFTFHYGANEQLLFCSYIELIQARLLTDPDTRYSRICVYDSETEELLYDTGKVTMESAYEIQENGGKYETKQNVPQKSLL